MKKIGLLVLGLSIVSCGSKKISQKTTLNPEKTTGLSAEQAKQENHIAVNASEDGKIVKFTEASQVKQLMEFLASDELLGRDSGSKELERAGNFIEGILKKNHIQPYFKDYKDTLTNFEPATFNVVGILEGTDPKLKDEYIIIGAHYDHIGTAKAVGDDVIANGANDNASGTTTVLELARYFGNQHINKRSIIFAWFTAEEKGLLGSKHLAKRMAEQGLKPYVMLNFEMVGVPMVNKDYMVYLTGYELSNLADVCNSYAGDKLVGFLPEAKKYDLFKRSDNYAFHEQFHVPSQTFSTFDFTNFDYYHKVGDEANQMDFEHMAAIINRFIPVIQNLSNTVESEIKYY